MTEAEMFLEVSELMRDIPELTSLLYDLNLMPEQVESKEDIWKMANIANHFKQYRERIKK